MEEARNTPLPPGDDNFGGQEAWQAQQKRESQYQGLLSQSTQKVKLSQFREKDPLAWFQLAEAVFNRLLYMHNAHHTC